EPDTYSLVMIACASCTLFGAYHYSVVAIRLGEVSLTAPFRYSVILWGLLVGYLVWGDVPGLMSLAGMVLITLAGLYVIHRERVTRQRAGA
ncbi:MAG: DMT family transporter, partial [Rhizobiales bacterium]|nr:DMT family transporter [Hyphomicrobiales bacterium]